MNPIKLSLLQQQLEGVAEVMGTALSRSAFSPNIRVRLDFSCALFNSSGELLAQAAHIPVHLGSMPDQIKRLVATQTLSPGDIFIANDPYDGGTHLPDITLMDPVFHQDLCLGVVAARAHHADVGGVAPGSMASQPNIYGDGIRIPILRIAREGEWNPDLLHLLLTNMRSPADREGDLMAQQAALHHGKLGMQRIFREWAGAKESTWLEGQSRLFEASRNGAIAALAELFTETQEGVWEEQLEIGGSLAPIRGSLKLDEGGRLLADFCGTSDGVAAGFNATLPVTKAAVCYVVRCLTPERLPLNQGFIDCIRVIAPEGSLVSASYPLAVAAGNVETSQRIVDTVFGAFSQVIPDRVPAASAGTMNNFSFGFDDPEFGVHYETSGGGAGGCPGGPAKAASAVQVHMTNTLSTPAEVLEEVFPVRVVRHQIRDFSGGAGEFSGGDGTVKEFLFEKDAQVTFMTTRRETQPYGLQGGQPGRPGRQALRSSDGAWQEVEASSTHALRAGDSVRLETPGGGGWGEANELFDADECDEVEIPFPTREAPTQEGDLLIVPRYEELTQENPIPYLLTTLFELGGGVLEARYQPEASFPVLYRESAYAETRVLFEFPDGPHVEGLFRNWLACLGSHYMDGEVYGGSVLRRMKQGEKTWRVRLYMSNDLHTGFWFEAYAAPAQ